MLEFFVNLFAFQAYGAMIVWPIYGIILVTITRKF